MTLLELQRRMSEDVRRPLAAGFNMTSTASDGVPMEAIANTYIKPNDHLSSFDRLEIYNRQYWFRVIAAVSEDYPAVRAIVGDKKFDHLILEYLKVMPSESWNLRDLSAKLPEFIMQNPSLAGRRYRLVHDIARLEWAYIETFDSEQLTPLSAEDIALLGQDSTLQLQPHVHLLQVNFPVDDLVLNVHRQVPENEVVSNAVTSRTSQQSICVPAVAKQRLFLVVHRYDDTVYYRRVDSVTYRILKALQQGNTLATAIETVFAHGKRGSAEEQVESVRNTFAHATELGWLCRNKNLR